MSGPPSLLVPCRTIVTSCSPRRPSLEQQQQQQQHCNDHITSTTTPQQQQHRQDGDWIIDVKCMSDVIAASLSTGKLCIYDTATLRPILPTFIPQQSSVNGSNNTATSMITDLQFVGGANNSNVILTSHLDGRLMLTDLRVRTSRTTPSSQPQHSCMTVCDDHANKGTEFLCCSLGYDDTVVATGCSNGQIYFCDLRKTNAVLGKYQDVHTDSVTALQFQNSSGQLLLSGGEDGLVNLLDTSKQTEQQAVSSVMNVGASVRKVGFCGQGYTNATNNNGSTTTTSTNTIMYCLTGSETASIWDADSAQMVTNFGGPQLRQYLGNADYLIDAMIVPETNELVLAAGKTDGNVALYGLGSYDRLWTPYMSLCNGHQGVVRALGLTGSNYSTIITAGEDARLCEWKVNNSNATAVVMGGIKRTAALNTTAAATPDYKRRHYQQQ